MLYNELVNRIHESVDPITDIRERAILRLTLTSSVKETPMSTQPKVNVLVGTRKGGFIFTSDQDRQKWSVSDSD